MVESQSITLALLIIHYVVKGLLSHGKVFFLGRVWRFIDDFSIPGHSLHCLLQLLHRSSVQEGSFCVRIEISQSRAELLPSFENLGGSVEFAIGDRVVDDLYSLEIGLKLDEVTHHSF